MVARSKPRVGPAEPATDTPGDGSPFALGLLLRRAQDRAAGALLQALRPLGLELRHFAVLSTLAASGSMSQSELVAAVGTDKASMVRVVDDLERADLVVRRPFPGDRRVHAVEPTRHGIEVVDAATTAAGPIADGLVAHLGPGEADQLLDLLARFTYPD